MSKVTCPYCGKPEIDGRHTNMCSKNPKNIDGDMEPVAPTPTKAGSEPVKPVAPGVVDIDGVNKQICPRCGAVATKFDNWNWLCPVDGHYDSKAPLR
jgi:endogenous inhibitor of DNA gyrase (YacG/DUF329 family)